jgi:two-component system sensor histidine kinase YesM
LKEIWRFINKSTKRRLQFYFVTLLIIPLFITNMITYMVSEKVVREETVSSAEHMVKTALLEMEGLFSGAVNICKDLNDNAVFQRRLRAQYNSRAERFSDDLQGGMELEAIMKHRPEFFGLYVLGENGSCYKSNMYSFRKMSFKDDTWYQSIISQDMPVWFKPHEESFVTKTTGSTLIHLGMPYFDKASGKKNGVIVVDIEEEKITSFMRKQIGEKGYAILLDENNSVIVQSTRNAIPNDLFEHTINRLENAVINGQTGEGKPVTLLTEKALIVYQKSVTTGWKLVGLIPVDEIYGILDYVPMVLGVIIMLFGTVGLFLSIYLTKKFTNPITKMRRAMKFVEEGDLSIEIEPVGEDELAHLAVSFNHMIERIRNLLNLVYEKQKLLRKSEYKALQAQINPHFLYNSLDSIVWLLKMKRNEKAVMMLQSLNVLFRISLSKGSEIIPIQKEVQHVESYLKIQSIRYSKKFDYSIDVDKGTHGFLAPKLLLQPLAENSIYHGLSMEIPRIHIDITVRMRENDIVFCVRDNGRGMTEEKLSKLRENVYADPGEDTEYDLESCGYGLRNVNGRIKMYYGEQYGLTIESENGKGTEIKIVIAKVAFNEE